MNATDKNTMSITLKNRYVAAHQYWRNVILETLNANADQWLTLKQIAAKTGPGDKKMTWLNVNRHIKWLVDTGLIEWKIDTAKYHLPNLYRASPRLTRKETAQ
jgi:hypothetical protein